MITRQGFTVALAGVGIASLGRVFGVLELYLIGSGCVAAVLFGLLVVRFGRVRLGVARVVEPSRVFVDEIARVELTVTNEGWHATPVVRLLDPVAGTVGATVSVAPLPAGKSTSANYRLPTERRGRIVIGPMLTERRDLLGVARRSGRIPGTSEVLVYPEWQLLDVPDRWTGSGPLAAHLRLKVLARTTDEFRGLRNYVPGDDLRRVHWKQSARTDDLKIKQTDPDAVRRIGILLDVTPERYRPMSFESAVSAATSIALSADRAGWRVQGSTSSTSTQATEDLEDYLETLALAQPERSRPLPEAVQELSRHYEGGLIVVVTGTSTGEALAAARAGQPNTDAGLLVVCDGAVPAPPPGVFVLDGRDRTSLRTAWDQLIGSTSAAGGTGS